MEPTNTGPDLVAIGALVVAVIALGISVLATLYTKRQADAAEGNLAADFEMTAPVKSAGEMGRPLSIDVRNHNRQTIHIRSFTFTAPGDIKISHKPSPTGAFSNPARRVVLKYPIAVGNIDRENGRSTRFNFAFRSDEARSTAGGQFLIECTVGYSVGSGRWTKRGRCAKLVDR